MKSAFQVLGTIILSLAIEYIGHPRPFVEDENYGFVEMAKQLNVKI
jgi:hypothetical protein